MRFEPGDILACYGSDLTSRLIRLGTVSCLGPRSLWWPPSHVAVICQHQRQSLWIESTTLCQHPCRITGVRRRGVQAHRPCERLADYLRQGGHVDLYRLTDINRLSSREADLLARLLIDHFVRRGIAYDVGGAVLSGTRVFQLLRLFPSADLESLFCSELIAAVLMRLGRMSHANPTRFHPGRLLRTLLRDGTYRRVSSLQPRSVIGEASWAD